MSFSRRAFFGAMTALGIGLLAVMPFVRILGVEDVRKVMDEAFLKTAERLFGAMHGAKMEGMRRNLPQPEEDEFENIL